MGIRKLMAEAYAVTRLPGSLAYLREGLRVYRMPREQMLQYQADKYRRLLRYAYGHTVYYRRVFDEIGLFRNGELREERLPEIPVLTKEVLRREQENLLSDEIRRRKPYSASTSGSTGIPLTLWYDRHYKSCNQADKMLMGILNGRDLGQPELKMWFRDFDRYRKNGKDKDRFFDFFTNRSFCLASDISEEALVRYIETINRVRPVQIWSNPAPVYEIAKYVLHHGTAVHQPVSILLTAGPLYDEMRRTIRQAFPETYVVSQYGMTEFGIVACGIREEESLRVFTHSVIAEVETAPGVLRPDGSGEIVVTGLNNYSMPLIRLKTGDYVTALPYGSEKEGSFPSLSEVRGRNLSMLRRRDGSFISGLFLRDIFTRPFIRTFRLVQHSYEDLEALVVPEGPPEEHSAEYRAIAARLGELVGTECRFTFCDTIPMEETGKYHYIRSEIK